jgi:hypothetical protein
MMFRYEGLVVGVFGRFVRVAQGERHLLLFSNWDYGQLGLAVGDWIRWHGGPGEELLGRLRRDQPHDRYLVDYDALLAGGHASASDRVVLEAGIPMCRRSSQGQWEQLPPQTPPGSSIG